MADWNDTVSIYPNITRKDDSISYWIVRLPPLSGPYRGYSIDLGIEFPANYPFGAPDLHFEQPIFHPQICSTRYALPPYLKSLWRCSMTPKDRKLYSVIKIVLDILTHPEPISDDAASSLLRSDIEAFERKIEEVMGPRR